MTSFEEKKSLSWGGGDYHSFNMFQKPVHVKDLGACYQFFYIALNEEVEKDPRTSDAKMFKWICV